MRVLLSLILLFSVSACEHLADAGSSKTVYFDFGSHALTNSAQTTIKEVAADIKRGVSSGAPWKHDNCHTKLSAQCQGREANVKLVGHTDTVGGTSGNMALSERRVNAVKNKLVRHGVDASAIATSAKGKSSPAVSTGDNVKEGKNRRVVIYVY